MFKPVKKEIRDEIMGKVQEGKFSVRELADQYGISDKTIYKWIQEKATPEINLVEVNRLKRENEELKRIIGIVTLQLEREKKGKPGPLSKRQTTNRQ